MKRTVLIVEDHAQQRRILSDIIRELDSEIDIRYAEDSKDAYKILMETTIDVFLLDIILNPRVQGDMSGALLARKIRTIPKYQFTPVIFVTSMEDPEIFAFRELHCYGYIEKPFAREQVQKTVNEALRYQTRHDPNAVLMFRKSGVIHPVHCRDILYMEMVQRQMHIYRTNGDVLKIPYKTCRQVLDEADDPALIQCSRWAIVNKTYVENIDFTNRVITMHGGARVTIGGTFVKKIKRDCHLWGT